MQATVDLRTTDLPQVEIFLSQQGLIIRRQGDTLEEGSTQHA